MNHFYAFIRKGVAGLMLMLLAIPLMTFPVNAEVVCLATTPISVLETPNYHLELAGNNLVFVSAATTLSRYDLTSGTTSPITSNFLDPKGSFDLDGDHIVFVDQAQQIQLYEISTGTTTAITADDKQHSDPRIEGNNVVYRTRKENTSGKVFYKLYVYDIAGANTTKVGHKYPKSYDYDLNQGRILWNGNTLYTIATHSNSSLGSYDFIDLDGNYAVTVFRDLGYVRKTLILKNLATGTLSTIAQYANSAQDELLNIENVVVSGDYVAWVGDYFDPEDSYQWTNLYQISRGKYIDTGMPDGALAFVNISEPFVTGKIYDSSQDYWSLYVYDLPADSLIKLVYENYVAAISHVTDQRNIAWVGAKYDGEVYEPTLLLHKDCGSTPEFIAQSPDLNILMGRSVDLFVTSSANQPIIYQWYQGEVGDTSLTVGSNSPTFTTPPLTGVTTYWVHASNAYGIEDSEPMTITPGDTAELVLNGSFEEGLLPAWQVKEYSFVYTVNDEAGEPPVVHSGEAALAVSADNGNFSKAKVKQQIIARQYQPGDQLTLSGWMKGKEITVSLATVQLIVKYGDGSKAKAIIKPTTATFDYTLFTAEPLTVSGAVSSVQLQIKYAGNYGPWLLDDISVIQSPSANRSAELLPLPPSGLTGSK